jgi:hypothetical protein
MPMFRIGGSMGYVGTDWEDVVEADSLEEAEKIAYESACERIDSWARPMDGEDEE